jgi:hypothetical protein
MKSPLTKKEKSDYLNRFKASVLAKYEQLLSSGACNESSGLYTQGHHFLLTHCIREAGEDMRFASPEAKQEHKNLSKF